MRPNIMRQGSWPRGCRRWLSPCAWWSALGMDLETLAMMAKGALTPTLVIAIHQSRSVADVTLTVGYLAALISVSAQCLLPRAKFVKIMFFSLLATCVAASMCCLACYTAVKARQSSGGTMIYTPDGEIGEYNSDACVVSAIWLIVMIWIANAFRAWRPQELQDPMVSFSIFCVVTLTRTGTFGQLVEGFDFILRLLYAFLIGLAVATAVSLFVLPMNCRESVFRDIKGCIIQAQDVLSSFVQIVETTPNTAFLPGLTPHGIKDKIAPTPEEEQPSKAACASLCAGMEALSALDAKLRSDLYYAKHEVAIGKLDASDLVQISSLLGGLLRPLSGMSLFPDILHNFAHPEVMLPSSIGEPPHTSRKTHDLGDSNKIVDKLRLCFNETNSLVALGLQYFLQKLEIARPNKNNGRNASQQEMSLHHQNRKLFRMDFDDPNFVDELTTAFDALPSRAQVLGLDPLSTDGVAMNEAQGDFNVPLDISTFQSEYLLVLHLINLRDMVAEATVKLASFSHKKVTDGTMEHRRLIYPQKLNPWEWLNLLTEPETSPTMFYNFNKPRQGTEGIRVVDAEHLAPNNVWERASGCIRDVSRLIGSELSMFGLRVSVASFCVAIVAFLRDTQAFFIHQRGVWAMIVIVIGMSPTSGQSLFGFLARVLATVVSVVLSLVAWYAAAEQVPGVVVFLFLANMIEFYVYVKKPQYFGPSVIAIVTLNVIVGYELQVSELGKERAESNGQPYYPIYIFGPYKLAAVAVGCAVSFFWVIFPYPITAKSKIPRLVGKSMFNLARFYVAMHTTTEFWINNHHGTMEFYKQSREELKLASKKSHGEGLALINALRMHSRFAGYEPPVGGKFPFSIYTEMITAMERTLGTLSLMAHVTNTIPLWPSQAEDGGLAQETSAWIHHLASATLESTDFQSQSAAYLLCHLGSSMLNLQPLPPFLRVTDSFPLARQLQRLSHEALHIRNARHPAFVAFVSLEVLRTTVDFELQKLLGNARILVGEVKFDTLV